MSAAARSFLPRAMDTAAILREHEDAQRRVLAEIHHDIDTQSAIDDGGAAYIVGVDGHGEPIIETTAGADPEPIEAPSAKPRPYHEVLAALRNLDMCESCGKTRVVLNNAGWRQKYNPERVTPETHCACVGGPAYAGVGESL